MRWNPVAFASVATIGGAMIPMVAQAKVYLSVEQAQKLIFGQTTFAHQPVVISEEVQAKMRSASSVSHPFASHRIWRTAAGGWFIVDDVVGKHEMITYALGIHPDGSVKQIEILEYRESYGYEVAQDSWRSQFVGKTVGSTLKLNKDIQNISGATLSAKHLTDGVKRLLVLHELVLKNLH